MKMCHNLQKSFTIPTFVLIFAICLFCSLLLHPGVQKADAVAIPRQNISIENQGKVSALLQGVEIRAVLEDMASKTGIELVGLDKVTGVIEDMEFKELSIEEAIRRIVQNNIVIIRKEGPEDGEKKVKKVIILARQEVQEEKPPAPVPPPKPPITPVPPPPLPAPVPEKYEPPKPPIRPTPPPAPPEPSTPPPQKTEPVIPKIAKPEIKPAPKPETPPVTKISDENLSKGLKYFSEKRWDLAAKYLKLYLKTNPGDQNAEEKIATATQNAQEAINLYKSANKAEDEGNTKQALELYQKSYTLYPLLFDTWERIKTLKKK